MKQFKDPYEGVGATKDFFRITTRISSEDYYFIRHLRMTKGTVTTTVNTLIKCLINELKRNSITTFDQRADFESFVANCTITDGRLLNGPLAGPSGEVAGSNDGRGTPPRGHSTKNTKNKRTNMASVGGKKQ